MDRLAPRRKRPPGQLRGLADGDLATKDVRPVQQVSTETSPSSNDLMRPVQACGLPQRPLSTSLPLVHTEEVTGRSRPGSMRTSDDRRAINVPLATVTSGQSWCLTVNDTSRSGGTTAPK
jgi:hypothetical protein